MNFGKKFLSLLRGDKLMTLNDIKNIIGKDRSTFSILMQRHNCGGYEIGSFWTQDVMYMLTREQQKKYRTYSKITRDRLNKQFLIRKMKNTVDQINRKPFNSVIATTSSTQELANEILPKFNFKKVSTFGGVHGSNKIHTWVYLGKK